VIQKLDYLPLQCLKRFLDIGSINNENELSFQAFNKMPEKNARHFTNA
jgi:hypothetical protein